MKVLRVFGNEWLEQDSAAYNLIRELEKNEIKCEHIKDPQQLLPLLERGEEITLLDVAEGIYDPIIITDLDQLETGKVSTLHDFDLAFFLKLLKEIGTIKEGQVRIVAVPMIGSTAADVVKLL